MQNFRQNKTKVKKKLKSLFLAKLVSIYAINIKISLTINL
jgi:hypothetical protein